MPAPKKNVVGYIAKKIMKSNAKPAKNFMIEPAPKKLKKVKPELKGGLTKPKSNVKVIPTGPLTPKQTEAKRIAKAKLRMMEINKKNPSWDK